MSPLLPGPKTETTRLKLLKMARKNKSKSKPSATVRRIYRKRVKNSTCRKKNRTACGKAPQCIPVSTKKRKYCRNRSNRYRLARVLGEGRKRRKSSRR